MTGIPHLQFDWHPQQSGRERINSQLTVNVAPMELYLSSAFLDILASKSFDWKSFTIAYEKSARMYMYFNNSICIISIGIQFFSFY